MKNHLKIIFVCALLFMSTAAAQARHKKDADTTQQTAQAVTAPLKCPKCQNSMTYGFILDQQGYNSQYAQLQWVEGPVKKGFSGVKAKVTRPIDAYRCTNCGYLELYVTSVAQEL